MTATFRIALVPALLFMSSFAVAQDAAPTADAPPAATTIAGDSTVGASETNPAQPPATSADAGTPATLESDPVPAVAPEAASVEVPETVGPGASASTTSGVIAAPPEGMGQVVFFRERKFAGAAIRYKVREGSAELGKLSSGTYFVVPVAPGAHEYTVHSEAKDILNLEIEAGETYYVIGSVTMGFFAGRPNLSPSDQPTFDGMLAKLKPAGH
jgi:hypothetical protein